ncbi:MAG: 3-deoxy-manno-octulosonate cytidylyltransferase [Rikenellaceae bacterium]
MRVLGVIPARYASTRFPAKPLAKLGGLTVIERVYRQVSKALCDVVVATDDERIFAEVERFGGRAVMTSVDHRSGTDRCFEAYRKVGEQFDIVVNVQGDEPFIQPEQIEALVGCFKRDNIDIATLVKPFEIEDGVEALFNANSPKVVVSSDMRALYFSRSVIPYLRGCDREEWLSRHTYYKHIGMYGFRAEVLGEITAIAPTPLEIAESLEQLRWLESGYNIGVGLTDLQTIGIDTPEDLAAAEEFLTVK